MFYRHPHEAARCGRGVTLIPAPIDDVSERASNKYLGCCSSGTLQTIVGKRCTL